jgi:hypothetical protein
MEEVSSFRVDKVAVISELPADNSLKVLISSVMVVANPLISLDIPLIRLLVSLERFEVTVIPLMIFDKVWEML